MDALTSLGNHNELLTKRDSKRSLWSGVGVAAIGLVTLFVIAIILFLIGTIILRGAPSVNLGFLSQPPLENMTAGGIWPQIRGTLLLIGGTFLIALPIGILGGIFLAEYAGSSRLIGLVRGLITSLAGTPSIIYALFGLAVFVLILKLNISVIAGWLTLATMALPVIVLSTEQALKAVPNSQIEAGYALGMTRWQVMSKVALPQAMPGIITGIILASGRAAGEAPPIIITAGIYFRTEKEMGFLELIRGATESLPLHITEGLR
ncbi:MAG: phosphate ABC transporter permease PstA [Fimbriimonadaceae bacterium]|jgi:phosphate transport system permease protein|nr:phosphate ABC transporter permease PstA [Fimbriimonadaceae bacterium]